MTHETPEDGSLSIWQIDHKGTSLSRFGLQFDIAVLQGDDLSCQITGPIPDSFLIMYFRLPVESGEDCRLPFRRDAFPGIRNADLGKDLLTAHEDMNLSSFFRVFDGVVENIKNGFRRPFFIVDEFQMFVVLHVDRYVFFSALATTSPIAMARVSATGVFCFCILMVPVSSLDIFTILCKRKSSLST